MSETAHALARLRQLLLSTHEKQRLEALKDLVRKWYASGNTGQDAINRAVVRAIEEVQHRLDQLIKI